MRKLIALLALSMVGCSHAYWIEKRYQPVRGGQIGYRNEGWGIDGRREEAAQQMRDFCAPARAEIVAERNSSVDQGAMASGSMIVPISEDHAAIVFVCKPASP